MKQKSIKEQIMGLFGKDSKVVCQEFLLAQKKAYLFYISCLVNKEILTSGTLTAIRDAEVPEKNIIENLAKSAIAGLENKVETKLDEIQSQILSGSLVIAVEGEKSFLVVPAVGYSTRSIAEPPTGSVLRGPREGFIEDMETNISLIRRRLKSPTLAVKDSVVGKRTSTKVSIVYLDGVANPEVVKEIEKRLKEIDIDGIIDSYYIEEMLVESGEKFFKRIGTSEKPDVVSAKILEGRVAIVVDGSPIVLTAPFIYFEDLQSAGDYYDIPARTSIVRFLRLVGLLLAVLLPGIYVALQSYQYRALPINFLISLLNSIEGLSFPPILEILFVLFLFEILSEASVRMPKQLGMALSIIGALILGDTAVQAGLIAPPSIVVVAISGITIYIIPNQSSELNILRTLFTVLGGIAGFYGIYIGTFILVTYLVSLETYGAPYFAPYAPNIATDHKDGFIKEPVKSMIYRPKSFKTMNSIRQQPFSKKIKEKKVSKSNKKEALK